MTFSLLEFAAKLFAIDVALDEVTPEILAKSCALMYEDAKGLIGVPKPQWPQLAPETLARKGGINTPLQETGTMRASIAWNSDHHEGYVGSNDKVLIYQEFGTSRGIPPRPVLGLAAVRNEEKIGALAERAVADAIAGFGALGVLRHSAHLLRRTAEGLNEMAHGDGDDHNQR